MAVIKKTLFPKNLEKFAVLVDDTQSDSKYFKITELPDTFTGGKNAFLIAGSDFLVPDTKIQIELKDSAGNIIYHEPGEGMINTNISGSTNTSIITEYYEGVSKVVAVYVYPDTAYGPCTLTILGELSEYQDANGLTLPVPLDWENKYNVKWQKQIDVNPSLANTTKIRFYKRPIASITELLEPVYRIESGSKVSSGINQSFANIKISQLETFAGDVKRVKVFRTSLGDISDFSLIQDILVESKELLTTFALSGSVIGNTGTFTSETFKNFWNTGSLNVQLSNSRVENGIKMNGSGKLTYTSSLDLKSANTYELNLDAFYSASTSSNLGIYLSYLSQSTTFTSSIATLVGTQPTKNLLDTVIPFKIDRDYPSASLYFSQSQGEWHLGNISLRLSQDTAFSPDEISFITTMPTVIGNEDFNFKFEFYDVNNNYVPVFVTQSANFTGGSNTITKLLTFESDRTAFRFSSGSFANPPNQSVRFKTIRTNFTGSITYASSAFDVGGTYIEPSTYAGTYPGAFVSQNDNGALLSIASFSGSVSSVLVGSIVYTASCEGFQEFETIYRFEDGDNAPGVFVTANTNQFIYKATDLSLNPTGQVITIEAKRKNLASATTTLTVNSGSGKPPLTLVSTNATNGVDTYTISGTSYPYSTGETIYSISGSDQFGNVFSDAIKISPVKILDGLSVSLTNDNASLPARSTGFVESGSFILSSGSVSVKVGNETITHSNGLSANNRFDVVSAVATNVQTGSLNYSTTDYFITRLDADSGSLNLTIRYKDGAGDTSDTTKLVTYTKNKKAAPVLQITSTPKDQTVTAKSTGEQIDAFSNVTVSVKQTYDGVTTNLTITSLTATSANISSISTTPSTGLVTLNGKTLANGVNSTTVDISAVVTDSEGVSRTITDTLALSKTKKAVPNVVVSATPQAQSVLANAAGVQTGALTNVTVTALEGTTSRFTSMTATYSGFSTNPTITTNTLTTDAAVITAANAEASATIVVTHTDSEGTTGQTQTIVVRFTKVPTGTAGTNGLNGADGGAGPGVVYRGDWAPNTSYFSSSIRVDVVRGSDSEYWLAKVGHTSTAAGTLDKPITGTSYTTYWRPFGATFESVATDILLARDATITRGLVMGTYGATDKGFIRSANATALMSGKGYYLDTTGSMRFGDPSGAHIKFTESEGVTIAGSVSISGTATIGGTSATTVKDGAASGATAQQNNSAKTDGSVGGWTIDSTAIYRGTKGANDTFTTNAGDITFGAGWISAKEFKISSTGAATFAGSLSAAGGTFAGNLSAAGGTFNGSVSIGSGNNIFKADASGIYLGNATFASAPFRVSMTGALVATSATITGAITATSGYIGTAADGWTISSTKITSKNSTVEIDSTNDRIDFKSGGVVKTRIKSGAVNIGSTSTTSVTVSGAGSNLTTATGDDSNQYGPLTALAYTQGTAQIAYISTPSGVDGNNVALVIPYPAVTSLGFVQCHNMGTGASCQYAYYAYVNYIVKKGGTGETVASGYITIAQLEWSNTFLTPFGSVDLPGFGGGTVTIPSIGTAVSTQVYTIEIYLGTIVQARINPNGTTPLTAAASLYTIAYGWDSRTANATLLAVAPRAEFGTNGVQIGSAEGSYVALGDAAGAGNVGVFAGNVSVTGTIAAGSVTASDIRAKTNIKTILNGIETIKKLNPVSYDWLQHITGNFEFEKGYGFIADDIQQIMPELIYEKKGYKYDDFKHLDYTSFHAIAIKAIQELTEKVEKLEAQISGSNNQIEEVI
jgi:hypothetical protein